MTQVNPQSFSDIKVNSPNSGILSSSQDKIDTSKLERTPEEDSFVSSSNTKKKTLIAGAFLAAIAAAGAGIFALSRGKSVKLKDIKFDKGVASFSNGGKFSGKIQDKLKNGDKIILEYSDGILQKSSRKGSVTFEKTYETINGEKIVKTIQNGKTKEVNISKLQNEVKTSQSKLDNLLKNQASMSLEDFQKQAGEIKYKNNSQKAQIEKIVADKKDAIAQQRLYARTNKKLSEITFKNGRAYFGDELYFGKVHHELPNGDKVVLEYNLIGQLKKSEISGSKNIIKEYDTILGDVKITENASTRTVNPNSIKQSTIRKLEIQKANEARLNAILQENDLTKVNSFLNEEYKKFDYEKLSEEQLEKVKNLRDRLKQKNRYADTLARIEAAKKTSTQADALIADSEFGQKFDTFMNTKYKIPKGKYDMQIVETTLDDVLKGTVIGELEDIPRSIYHGTSKYSYDDILKSGFSLDAANITESGKGIYFGLDKAGAEKYCGADGRVVQAQYTGRKVARVTPGVMGELHSFLSLKDDAQKILGIDTSSDKGSDLLKELIAKRYTKLLSDMGFDAVQTSSIGAGCKYMVVLDPKNIKIINQ